MIFTERTITVVNDSATINKPLILYRGDKNIELKITIAESQFKFRNTDASNVIETTDASYAQLVINTPYNSPIFSDVAATKNGAVIFVITEAMIDEIREVGAYEIQIRLLDDNKQSRASIPPVSNAIEIREPIAIEDGSAVDSNAVNVAKVNRALTTTSAPLEAFDSQGNYIKKTWGDGDPITDAALNKMEAGIDGVNKKIANVNNINDTTASATTTYSSNKIETIKENINSQIKEIVNKVGDEKIVDLVMFMGQSNMAGKGVASKSPIVPVGHGFEFKAISDPTQLYNVTEPFGVNENNSTSGVTDTSKTGSMVSSFMIGYYDVTGVPIVGVSCAKSGTSINWWKPGGKPLNDAINRHSIAKQWLTDNGYTIRRDFMVWCQGETDGDNAMPSSEYITKIKSMIEEMCNNGIEMCYIVRIGNHRDNPTLYDNIINAQTELCKTYNKAVLVSTKFDSMATEGLMSDLFHYTQEGYNITGLDAGKNTGFHVTNNVEPYMYDWEHQNLYFPYTNVVTNITISDNKLNIYNGTALLKTLILPTSTGAGVDEKPSTEAEPTMKIIKKYSAYYIRTKWNDTYDMVEQIAPTKGSNGQFNFALSYLIEAATDDKNIDNITTTVKKSADDACPLCINNGYVGGNHGLGFKIDVTATSHNKVAADIGSIWKDENNVNFTLISIKDANTLYFLSDDKSAEGTWEFSDITGSTLTHVSGATNTGAITVEASVRNDLHPIINNYTYTMKTEKGDFALTASFETAEATHLEITETFDIMDANAMITYLRENVGNNTNDSFHDNSIAGVVGVTNKYHFRPNGSCTIYTKYEVKKKIALSKNTKLLGYIGFTQAQQMPKPTGGTWNLYIPDINPISDVEYDTSVAQVAKIPATYIDNCKNDKVASRLTQYYTDSSNNICNNYGFTSGYNTDLYLGRHEVRKNNVNRIFSSGTKMYISGISVNSTNYDSYVNAGEVLEMVSFRINENYSKNPDFTSCNYYYVGDDIYYNIAIHKDFEGKIPVIGAMYGMNISVVEDNGNVVITDEYVKKSGIGITVTNNYGYAILKLTKSNV